MAKKVFSVILLAAGKGTRMKSPLPKVLHPIAGSPMIRRAAHECNLAGADDVRVVVGYGANLVKQVVEPLGVTCHMQNEQRGTADAVRSANPETMEGTVVILNGDHPLISAKDIEWVVEEFDRSQADLAVISTELNVPGNYGRIVRHGGRVRAIVEAKDASHETKKIKEVNTGVYVCDAEVLNQFLPKIESQNAQNEFYLTDIISLSIDNGLKVDAFKGHKRFSFGVNSQVELAKASQIIFKKNAHRHMEEGVVIIDPANTFIEDEVTIGPGSVIYPGAFLKGKTSLGQFSVVEPNCFILNAKVGESVQIKAGSYIESAKIDDKSMIGPYAHLRPGSELGKDTKVGNFVELKKAKMGDGSKASHLTYLGDAEIGKNVNIGCGTITCNYAVDKKKYKTTIKDNVFVGSDTQFVAPVEIGEGAIIASGSTITKNVPDKALAVARGRQITKENYATRFESSESTEKKSESSDSAKA